MPARPATASHLPPAAPRLLVAYFSMEVALDPAMPTYSGGLGVLAGDTLRTAADLGLTMIGITLLSRLGYFQQHLDRDGRQREEPAPWPVAELLEPTPAECRITLEGQPVAIRAWRYEVEGAAGGRVPVLFLDTDVPGNAEEHRRLTDRLYGGDERYRLAQEAVLGIGGVRMLRALGHTDVTRFHMNEGHAALLAVELFREAREAAVDAEAALERVKRLCVFTTHTPVPVGHDRFPPALVDKVLGGEPLATLRALGCCDTELNMTQVALRLSHWVNGVSRRHTEVSTTLFPGYPVGSITNGVHSRTWTAEPFRALYDRHMPGWPLDNFSLRYARNIPLEEIRRAHEEAKRRLVETINIAQGNGFQADVFTVGFARRATAYKRADLLFRDPGRLARIAARAGPLQVVFAGKAHPRDEGGKRLIETIFRWQRELAPAVRIAYLADYDLALAGLLTSGVDLWLNTPKPPYEASGTSGMKAAHNGVPSLSVLDGWWWEGHVEGVTGWAVGAPDPAKAAGRPDEFDADELYAALEQILVLARDGERWADIMRSTIAINASFFNTQRMLGQYVVLAYRSTPPPE